MNRLAIAIPAYKPDYLEASLESLARQSDRDFVLHVCDDASPHPRLREIVARFESRLDLRYHRFAENLGGTDLVGHWNRCLELADSEWFWLFSDDDVMEDGCVAALREVLEGDDPEDVLRFDLSIVEYDGRIRRRCADYPAHLGAAEFLRGLFTGRLDARMPEYVFRTDALRAVGGFQSFEFGFRADNATVIRCAWERGIRTVPGPRVRWRRSEASLSTRADPRLEAGKCAANTDFFLWAMELFAKEGRDFSLGSLEIQRVLVGCAYPVYRREGWDATRRQLERIGRLRWPRVPLPIIRLAMRTWAATGFVPRTF